MLGAIQRATLLAHIAAEVRGCFAASPWLWHSTGQSRGTRDNSHCLSAALDITPGLREKLRPACWEAEGQAAHGCPALALLAGDTECLRKRWWGAGEA